MRVLPYISYKAIITIMINSKVTLILCYFGLLPSYAYMGEPRNETRILRELET